MRPLRLQLKGFTAFREEQVLDLSGLGLFALWGPTGSGKSSLLDAVTYALFGQVERVGNQVGQLITHGQPRMTVSLEFAVGDDRYRVTRSTPRNGATKIMLERATGEEWEQAGEGADRVRDVNRSIVRLIGLDYDAFTRSVLLPQGKFAEFLVGDAKQRREILTELLGLELFTRMAKRAGEIAKDARTRAETMASLLEREYAGVTEDALAAAKQAAEVATAREETLVKASARVQDLADRWRAARAEALQLRALAEQARGVAASLGAGVASLRQHLAAREALDSERSAATQEATTKKEAAGAAAAARAHAEVRWGSTAVLAAACARAERLPGLRTDLEAARAALDAAEQRQPLLAATLTKQDEELAAARAHADDRARAVEQAREAYREAARTERVAAVCAGLHPGDPCPVCGTELRTVPAEEEARARLTELEQRGTTLERERVAAERGVTAAQRARDGAERDLAEAAKEIERARAQVGKAQTACDTAEQEVASAFEGVVPKDPVNELTKRLQQLEDLTLREKHAHEAAAKATERAASVERRAAQVETELAVARATIASQPLGDLLAHVVAVAGGDLDVPAPMQTPDDPVAAADVAELQQRALEALTAGLNALADARTSGEAGLLAEATTALEGAIPEQPSFESLLDTLSAQTQSAIGAVARARRDVETMTERLTKRREMADDIDLLATRADRFRVLAQELRADRLIAFLQGEALTLLCDAGSAHLGALSDGRYRIVCEADEFQVVDTWNGEEQRSVRTLSGGETFMASLSLALALSEQVQALAVTQKARLDSLFLDEGFGTLDANSLQEVVEALEQLGGGGRMVGVVTHIPELADQLPAKIVVQKSQRGSTLSVEPTI